MSDTPFRLDRTKFKMQTFNEASHQLSYWQTKTPVERLQAAYFLISQAYNFDLNNPPKEQHENKTRF
ncbi:hypothetical protein [Lewinella cohaerens]|uniref:hypothetical protein n=1 Tax=Lewinella cohaerens TaxID=70995 RepID=UPI00037BB55D|nr:hypothetical protein [Lewinella cohaerens]